jgi:hypothetical protein
MINIQKEVKMKNDAAMKYNDELNRIKKEQYAQLKKEV